MNQRDGPESSFQATHESPLVNNRKVLAYGCRVDRPGKRGDPLGVLGIFFNRNGLVDAVLGRICRLDLKEDIENHRIPTEISIIDGEGIVLASTASKSEGKAIGLPNLRDILESRKSGYAIIERDKGPTLIAYGYSPGGDAILVKP